MAIAVASAAAATALLGPAASANASCASIFGIGNSGACTSTFGNIAIGIGDVGEVSAKGFLSAAIAIGPDSYAATEGVLSAAIAAGTTGGILETAVAAGRSTSDFLNFAISLANDSDAEAGVASRNIGDVAINLGQGGRVRSGGVFSVAASVGGNKPYTNNNVTANGFFDGAVNLFGNHNTVTASPGPLAIAIAAFHSGATVTKQGPGINIGNTVVVGGAAATAAATPTAGSGRRITKSLVANHTITK